MRFEDLIDPGAAPRPPLGPADAAAAVAAVRERATAVDHAAKARDLLETGVAALMLPLFAWLALQVPHPLSKVGATMIAAGCVLVPLRLRLARGHPVDAALPVLVALAAERARLESQAALLNSIGWWYLGPLLGGALLFLLGAPLHPIADASAVIVIGFCGVVLYRANIAAVRRELDPLIARINDLMRDLHEPTPGAVDD